MKERERERLPIAFLGVAIRVYMSNTYNIEYKVYLLQQYVPVHLATIGLVSAVTWHAYCWCQVVFDATIDLMAAPWVAVRMSWLSSALVRKEVRDTGRAVRAV